MLLLMKLVSPRKLVPQKPPGESSSVPPSASTSQTPLQASEPISEPLPDYAEVLRERGSKQMCQQLHYLIERQKQINATYPPLPDRILSKDGQVDIDDDDIDNVDDLYDLICLQEVL